MLLLLLVPWQSQLPQRVCARKYPIPKLNWMLGMNVEPNEFFDFLHSLIDSGQTSDNLILP